jgi:outer membrane protein insertion porin family
VLDTEWDGFITGFVEQAIRPGFDLFSRGLNAQIRRQLNSGLAVSVDYGLGQNNTTNKELNAEDEPLVDRLFPEVRLSAFSGSIVLDRRDDPTDPRSGELYTVDVKLAARAIGSEVGFLKTYVGAFMYREIPAAPRLVFAGGARMGLASAFVRSVTVMPVLPPDPDFGGVPASAIELDVGELPLSERFFAGGDSSVRGFALDRLGDEATIDQDGFPQGGNATLVFNAELRVSVTRAVEVVGFLDAGNVYDRVSSMSLARIRGGAGFGVRYRSPVGPIRVDLGFKLDRQEFGNGELEQPTTLHISIGQAF